VMGVFRDKASWTVCLGWLQTTILLITASLVARIIGVRHRHPAYNNIFYLSWRDWKSITHWNFSSDLFSFRLADVRNQVIFAVRQEYVELGDQLLLLQPGDEIAIIPPISGG
jgi:hypothetical protein